MRINERAFTFNSFSVQDRARRAGATLHLPKIEFGEAAESREYREREASGNRAVVVEVAPRAGEPAYGYVQGRAVFLELERADFVRTLGFLRQDGAVTLLLRVDERGRIVSFKPYPIQVRHAGGGGVDPGGGGDDGEQDECRDSDWRATKEQKKLKKEA